MPHILLVGSDTSLLEGLAQSLSAQAHTTLVAGTLAEARDLRASSSPLIAVVEHALAADAPADVLALSLAPGGAVVLYRSHAEPTQPLPHVLKRHVLAELSLPLERNRLCALVQHVKDRATAAGRGRTSGETEQTV